MAEFSKLIITNYGQELLAKMIAGTGNIDFTKISSSSTVYTESQLAALTALSNIKQTSLVSKVTRTNNVAIKVESAFSNADLTTGYYMRTLGLYAIDPDRGEILYAVTIETSGNCYMPPYNGVTVTGAYLQLITTVGNASSVSLEVDPGAYATIGDIQELELEIADLKAFVGYTDGDIYGVEVDFTNRKFTRLAGAVNKTPGDGFNAVNAFGGRKRCIITDDGKVLAYYGEAAYTETGSLIQAVTVGGTTYAVGTKVQVMVEQPKFYYKVVPLTLDKTDFKEINTIAVTGGATASGNLTISLDGVNFTVAVTSGDDATAVATKIRNATYTGWLTGGSGTSVTFTCNVTGTKVTATVTAASTGVTTTVTKTQPGYKGKGHHMRKARYYVSDTPRTGFKLHPAFVSNNVKKNFIYLSAYEASLYDVSASAYILDDAQVADFTVTTGDKMCSIANAKPMSGLTQNLIRSNTRKLAQNRGTGWQQAYTATVAASHLLMLIEYASFNMQSKIGNGAVSKVDDGTTNMSEPTGATTLLGNASGIAVNTNGIQFVSYRGEENFWGNIWKWVDGINIYANNEQSVYVADNGFTDDVSTSPYSDVGFTGAKREGYVSAFGYSEGFDWLFYPSETFGDSNLPVGDYHWLNSQSNGWFVGRLGGSWDGGSIAGAFYWSVAYASSFRYRSIGGRLVYVPSAVA